jgi:hypothetical protein
LDFSPLYDGYWSKNERHVTGSYKQDGIEYFQPYRNVCAFDSRQILTTGIIKDLQVHLAKHLDVMITVDVVVLDIPTTCRMWLSQEWSTKLGGTLHMDLSYATITESQRQISYPI